ncbi:hypothetical protein [Streptomyces sp. NPDC018610]|uniref:hypothetical protein n=1 Tax=Streptomyces sp. NPDC018610 TaxID=3365049 RepID=UPI0037B74EE7
MEIFTGAVRGRAPGERALAALLRLGLELLDRRHPLSGVGQGFGDFWQVVLDSAALRARAREGLDELENALTRALAETAPEEYGDPRLATAAYRAVCAASVGRLLAGAPVDEVAEDHRVRLTAAFDALERAFPPPPDATV